MMMVILRLFFAEARVRVRIVRAHALSRAFSSRSMMMMYDSRTGNDGLLGSRLDEGRREMRYALRIAGSRESFDFPTHMRPRRKSRARRPQVFTPRPRFATLERAVGSATTRSSRGSAPPMDCSVSFRSATQSLLVKRRRRRRGGIANVQACALRVASTRASILRPTRKPAEVKHINKRRKRNQQGCP